MLVYAMQLHSEQKQPNLAENWTKNTFRFSPVTFSGQHYKHKILLLSNNEHLLDKCHIFQVKILAPRHSAE